MDNGDSYSPEKWVPNRQILHVHKTSRTSRSTRQIVADQPDFSGDLNHSHTVKYPPTICRCSLRSANHLAFKIEGQSVEIFEIRPAFRDPSSKIEESVAKATFVKRANHWRIYWQRSDLKWYRYESDPEVDTIQDFLRIVDEDEWCCFWG